MIVLEGQQPLGADTRRYYSELIAKLEADKAHVEHVQDLWSDPLTATGVQSGDGKAVYVSANLAGNQGEALSLESIEAVKNIVESTPAPDGVDVYVTGSAAMTAEQTEASHGSMRLIEGLTNDRVVSAPLPSRETALVVALAKGDKKLPGLRAALNRRLVNGVITDERTATQLLAPR